MNRIAGDTGPAAGVEQGNRGFLAMAYRVSADDRIGAPFQVQSDMVCPIGNVTGHYYLTGPRSPDRPASSICNIVYL